MKVMAIDYGTSRVGVAILNSLESIPMPLPPIKGGVGLLARLQNTIRECEPDLIVVGLPIRLDGQSGQEVVPIKRFAARLARTAGVKVEFQDERLTTMQASKLLYLLGKSAKAQKQIVDSIAAAIILESWQNRVRRSGHSSRT